MRNSSSSSESAPTPAPERLLLSIPEAAAVLGCTVWSLRELLWAKKIKFVQIGRRFLISPKDLQDYIDKNKDFAA
jgi:excisionase family DNA binding protein